MNKFVALALVALIAIASVAPAMGAESVPIPPVVNCNRTCWSQPGLEGLKKQLFRLCKAKAQIIETVPGKYGCGTYMDYRFKSNKELVNFQNCQSEQKLFIDKVFNPGYKKPLTNPPSTTAAK